MMSRWIMTGLLSLSLYAICAGGTAQEGPPRFERNTLIVNGSGETRAKPDVAYVTVGVVTQGKRAQDASQTNAEATQKVIDALHKLGIDDKDLQTSGYSVQPIYENRPAREPVITGYQVSNQVHATIRKLTDVGRAIDAALDAGANNVQGVGFGLEQRDEAESAALTNAVKEARRKADTLARAAGVRITGIAQIQEGPSYRIMPRLEMATPFVSTARAPTPIAPGELTVNAEVSVVFTIGSGEKVGLGDLRQSLLKRRAKLERELAKLKQVYSDMHPIVRAKSQQIRNLDEQIRSLDRIHTASAASKR